MIVHALFRSCIGCEMYALSISKIVPVLNNQTKREYNNYLKFKTNIKFTY